MREMAPSGVSPQGQQKRRRRSSVERWPSTFFREFGRVENPFDPMHMARQLGSSSALSKELGREGSDRD